MTGSVEYSPEVYLGWTGISAYLNRATLERKQRVNIWGTMINIKDWHKCRNNIINTKVNSFIVNFSPAKKLRNLFYLQLHLIRPSSGENKLNRPCRCIACMQAIHMCIDVPLSIHLIRRSFLFPVCISHYEHCSSIVTNRPGPEPVITLAKIHHHDSDSAPELLEWVPVFQITHNWVTGTAPQSNRVKHNMQVKCWMF